MKEEEVVKKVLNKVVPHLGNLWIVFTAIVSCTWGFSALITKYITTISSDIAVINRNVSDIKQDIVVLKQEVADIKLNTAKNTVRIDYLEKKYSSK